MIKIDNLSYRYPGAPGETLKGIDFSISKGEVFGFLGPSGAGKSTTQKILFKLLSGYQGSVKIAEKEVRDWDHAIYQKIGVGFELPNHYLKLTALENLRFFKNFYSGGYDPMMLLEQVGLEKEANKKVADFSKGMKMRLNFVRSYMHDPEILFLDEPTSGLDPVNARIIKDIILSLKNGGKTIFITTHQMHDADELCDRVAFIVDGMIKTIDTPTRLKNRHSKRIIEVTLKNQPSSKIYALDGLGENMEFLELIRNHEIETLHSKEATLDEIFIQVTGKTLG